MNQKRITVWVQKFKDRRTLMLQWVDPATGKRKSRSSGTRDRRTAERAATDLEYELNHNLYRDASKITWAEFRQMFEDEYVSALRLSTREKYTAVLDVFEQISSPAKLASVDQRMLSQFERGMRRRTVSKDKTGLAPQTRKNYLGSLRKALRWAHSQDLIGEVPALPKVKVPRKKPRPVPGESYERLLEAAPDAHWRVFLMCAWWGGLRLSESAALRRVHSDKHPWVDWTNNRIVFPAEFVKSDEDQMVPLHPVLREALESLPEEGPRFFNFRSRQCGGPLTRSGMTSRVKVMAKRAGAKLSYHKLRKGYGCRAAQQLGKGNAPILHALMRHSSMQITMDYYANVDDALQDAIRELT
ncbi:MAG: hypothetical protein CMJ78_07480 [Planctomycetaceae bacterium]|nr:hypothetical protein [Planctomycetaceae bacterium]